MRSFAGTSGPVAANRHGRAHLNIGFILVPNFTLLPFAAFMDAIRLAADEGDRSRQIACRWTVMGEGQHPVKASCGVAVSPWEPFRDPAEFDYIAVVGGLLGRSDDPTPGVATYLRSVAAKNRALIGLGTGTFILARAGVMKDHRCCLSWYHLADFKSEFPDIVAVADQLYVIDRQRVTCAGGLGVVDLAGRLIEQHCGRSTAMKSLRMLLADAPKPSTNPQPDPSLACSVADPRVKRVILLIEQNLGDPPSVPSLAGAVRVSARQLERSFHAQTGMSVMAFARHLRLRQAQWLLAHSERTVTEIAQDCGFSDSSHLGRVFRRYLGVPPSSIRRRPVVTVPPVDASGAEAVPFRDMTASS